MFAYAAHIRLTARGEADLYGYIEQIRLTRVALRLGRPAGARAQPAYATARLSRITVILIRPGCSVSFSIAAAIS